MPSTGRSQLRRTSLTLVLALAALGLASRDASALELRLALGADVAADHDALARRARGTLQACAAGRPVEVWLTVERDRRRLVAVTRVVQRGVALGERRVYGRRAGPLVDAAALLTCVALERMPPAPPPRPDAAQNGRAPRRPREVALPGADLAGPPRAATPTDATSLAAKPESSDGVAGGRDGTFAFALQDGAWTPRTSVEVRAGAQDRRGPLQIGFGVALWWLPPADGDFALGAALRVAAGGTWVTAPVDVSVEAGALVGATVHGFAAAERQLAPWLAADLVVRAMPRALRFGRLALGVEVGATPRLWPIEVRAGAAGQLLQSGDPARLRAAIALRFEGSEAN